jgi:FkbM family methyltransferase
VRPGDVIFDIGAYVGPYTLLGARLAGPTGHVYAFEPDPVARAVLERNIAANHAENVTIVRAAVTAAEGVVWLESTSLGDAASAVRRDSGQVKVPATTLQAFCQRESVFPNVIKIDVEGGEGDVLDAGAAEVIRQARVILLEVHEAALRAQGIKSEALLASLSRLGKKVVEIDRRTEFEGNYNVALM